MSSTCHVIDKLGVQKYSVSPEKVEIMNCIFQTDAKTNLRNICIKIVKKLLRLYLTEMQITKYTKN